MQTVELHKAAKTLAHLIKAVESGEDVLLTRTGRAVARLTRYQPTHKGIKLGTLKGMFKRVKTDFDIPLSLSTEELWK
jgi:prevent-host-death family protein